MIRLLCSIGIFVFAICYLSLHLYRYCVRMFILIDKISIVSYCVRGYWLIIKRLIYIGNKVSVFIETLLMITMQWVFLTILLVTVRKRSVALRCWLVNAVYVTIVPTGEDLYTLSQWHGLTGLANTSNNRTSDDNHFYITKIIKMSANLNPKHTWLF